MSKKEVASISKATVELLTATESVGNQVISLGKKIFQQQESNPNIFVEIAKQNDILVNLKKIVGMLEKLPEGVSIIMEPIEERTTKKRISTKKTDEDSMIYKEGTSTLEKVGKNGWKIVDTVWD